ncbi:transposase [Brevibacterium oceani]|uniref:transposase n=1 Tax=Brevibacterium oceani TaxID=358099 RepID=UPI003CCEF294
MSLAQMAGLPDLAEDRLTVTTTGADKGANPAPKLATLVAGMAAGADSIDDMNILRHGGMQHLFDRVYAPSTLGSFLRSFAFGHVRQLDAISSRFLTNLNEHTPLLPASEDTGQAMVFVDVDDTVIDVHSASKQGAGFGYQGSRGLNALLATASTGDSGQIIVGQRLRKGSTSSARGADKFVADALATTTRINSGLPPLVRADSAYYSSTVTKAARDAGLKYRSRCAWTRRSKQRSEQSATAHGLASNTPKRSTTKRPGPGFRRPKSPRSRSPHSPRRRSPCTPPAAWWSAASRSSTRPNALPDRTHCSTCSAITRSSPRWTKTVSTPSLLITSTADTRSSSRSMRS